MAYGGRRAAEQAGSFLDNFTCCCVEDNHNLVPGGDENRMDPWQEEAAKAPERRLRGGGGPQVKQLPLTEAAGQKVTQLPPAEAAEQKEMDKADLQREVKQFAKEAMTGISVHLVDAVTGAKSPCFYQMDRYLRVFTLKMKDGGDGADTTDILIEDVTNISKGSEVVGKVPSLEPDVAMLCVCVETTRADRSLFFWFDDEIKRDSFFRCLKVLQMSVKMGNSMDESTGNRR